MRKIDFNVDGDEIYIIPIADVHIGSEQFDETLFKEVCEFIADNDNVYTILNGDLVDNATKNSIGSVFEQTMTPLTQVAIATNYLKKIAQKGKIISMTSGNHELRSDKDVGLSPSDLILANLMKYDDTLNERYSVDSCYTFLTLRPKKTSNTKITFTIYNLHGNGGGSKIGGKINKLDDMANNIQANIYIRSHTHIPETHKGLYYDVNTNTHTIRQEECLFVNTNAYLRPGGYGDRAGMKPMSRSIPVIHIKAKRKIEKGKDFYIKRVNCTLKQSVED